MMMIAYGEKSCFLLGASSRSLRLVVKVKKRPKKDEPSRCFTFLSRMDHKFLLSVIRLAVAFLRKATESERLMESVIASCGEASLSSNSLVELKDFVSLHIFTF